MAIVAGDIDFFLSGGAANADPVESTGGAKSSSAAPTAIFDTVTGAQSAAGLIEYRCIYIHNSHGSLPLTSGKVWLDANSTSGQITLGMGAAAVNATETDTTSETGVPAGVTFFAAANEGAALSIGADLPAGQHKAIWLKRDVTAGAAASSATYSITVKGDTSA